MQIALVTNLFPTPTDPNRGIYTLRLAQAMSVHVDLRVICPLPWFPSLRGRSIPERWRRIGGVPHRYEIGGIQVVSPKYPFVPGISEHIHHRLMAPTIGRALRDLNTSGPQVDLVNTHWLYPDAVAAQVALERFRTPHVATGLGSDVNQLFDDNRLKRIVCTSLRRCDAVTVVAASMKDRVQADCPGLEVEVVLNGVDHRRFCAVPQSEAREQLDFSFDARPLVLWIGRLSAEKNPVLLLRAARRLAAQGRSVRFVFIGAGPLASDLRDYVSEHGLSGSVDLLRERPSGEIPSWLNAADLLALTSDCEGCPNVVLEALACGTRVVATDVGSIPDVINDANGRRVPVGDPDAMGRAIAETLDTGPPDRGKVASTADHLSWGAAAERYCSLYSRLLDST